MSLRPSGIHSKTQGESKQEQEEEEEREGEKRKREGGKEGERAKKLEKEGERLEAPQPCQWQLKNKQKPWLALRMGVQEHLQQHSKKTPRDASTPMLTPESS